MGLLPEIFSTPFQMDDELFDLVPSSFPTGLLNERGGGFFASCERDDKGHCLPGEGPGGDKSKFVGKKVGKEEHVHAAGVEKEVAAAVKGNWEEDNAFYDVKTGSGAGQHFLEVKSMLKGDKTSISVHPDALLRKVDGMAGAGKGTFHTVVVDERATYSGGEYQGSYSGNRLYYKRGSGRYALTQMHPVKSFAELNRLLKTPDAALPDKARGRLPKGKEVERLREQATKAHSARLEKDRARKARIKAAKSAGT